MRVRDRESESERQRVSDGAREGERLQVRGDTPALGQDRTRGHVDGRQDSLECV